MPAHESTQNSPELRVALRNEPVQARSAARLSGLLDAAAAVIDEIGFERLTTAMVAERAGASIGTVYRYFPDRIVLLQALAARNLERVLASVTDEILDPKHPDWLTALSNAFASLVEAFRSEPGFRALRVGDVIDLRPAPAETPYNTVVGNRILDALIERFGVADSPELRFKFETAIVISDALAARAFARDPKGDESFLVAGRDLTYGLLAEYFGEVAHS